MKAARSAALVVLAITLVLPQPVNAQSRATGADLVGTVRDQTEAVLPGARVLARHLLTNVERSVTTDEAGRFSIPLLPPGEYEVTVASTGFTPSVQKVTLALGALVEIQAMLRIATATETVAVSAANPIVDLGHTSVAYLISEQQIDRLPIDVRNFISFAVITPGVAFDHTPQQGASATSGLTFSGQRARSNNVTVDGFDNNDPAAGGVRASFSQEAVREFQVLTSGFPAEFGNASGGVVNVVTRSGTNRIAGTGFAFGRDTALSARSHFEKVDPLGAPVELSKAPYSHQQFGGTLGGPIRRDATFFFLSYERLDVQASNLVTIDDAAVVRHPVTGAALGTAAEILRRLGFVVETGNVPYDRRIDQFLAKVDHHLRRDQMLTVRFHAVETLDENIEPFGGITARSRAGALDATDYAIAVSHTAVLSSRWLNELRFQTAYRDHLVRALDPACGGLCLQSDQGGPTVEVIGVASVGRHRFTPQHRNSFTYQVMDSVSAYLGRHAVKGGVELIVRDNRAPSSVLPLHFGGRYIFSPLPAIPGILPASMSAIQAAALGLPAVYVQGYGDDRLQLDGRDLAVFVEDTWRASPRFTLRAGLRYQRQSWADIEHRANGYPGAYRFPADTNNLAPRISVGWDVGGDQTTLVRGAYGVFHDNHVRALQTVAALIDGADHVRTLVARFPSPLVQAAWNSPGRRLPEATAGAFPSLQFAIDPDLPTPFAHHVVAGVDRALGGGLTVSVNGVFARGFNQVGTIDYNPIVRSLGSNRRPLDVNGVAGSSASVLQYSPFGETWYRGLVLSADRRFNGRYQLTASYTFSKAEDTATDFQSAFIPQQNGRGRDPGDPAGFPIGFDPRAERGLSTQDQRHRLVLSGFVTDLFSFDVSAIVTLASGRPYTILAGADLNGDGDGGAFPPDRARRDLADEGSSVGRNSATMPGQATVDFRVSRTFVLGRARVALLVDVFNALNRVNFFESSNTSSAFIFGVDTYPDQPLATFGRWTQTLPPRQAQVGVRVTF